MQIKNIYKTVKNLLAGKYLATLGQYYDPRYPPSKFLVPNAKKIHIHCILCGFPRSGTNWVLNVLEKSTGHKRTNLGNRKPTLEDKYVLCIKIHARSKKVARTKALWLLPRHSFDGKYIYMYRDPRDAITSLYQMYSYRKNQPDLSPEQFIKDYDPIGQYQWEARAWVMNKPRDVMLIKFEDLKKNPIDEFSKIFDYLGVEGNINPELIDQRINLVNASDSRPRAIAYGWKTCPAEYKDMIKLISAKLEKEIDALGYDSY